jgi:hypothetical protein
LAINRSKYIEIFNNRVQVNVAGDAAIKFFGVVSVTSASGNQYAGGSSDLKDGASEVPLFWFGRTAPSPACPTPPQR